MIRGTHGTLYSPGGEGSPQWWLITESRSGWQLNVVLDLHSGKAKPQLVTIPAHPEAPPVKQDDNLKAHTDDWLRCMRNRKTPNGNIETRFAHAVAVVMATRSYREGEKLYWDRKNERTLDRPVSD